MRTTTIHLILATVAGLAACFSPSLDDCQFACTQNNACPSGLACMAGMCRAPGASGACGGTGGPLGQSCDVSVPSCEGDLICELPPSGGGSRCVPDRSIGFGTDLGTRPPDHDALRKSLFAVSAGELVFVLHRAMYMYIELWSWSAGDGWGIKTRWNAPSAMPRLKNLVAAPLDDGRVVGLVEVADMDNVLRDVQLYTSDNDAPACDPMLDSLHDAQALRREPDSKVLLVRREDFTSTATFKLDSFHFPAALPFSCPPLGTSEIVGTVEDRGGSLRVDGTVDDTVDGGMVFRDREPPPETTAYAVTLQGVMPSGAPPMLFRARELTYDPYFGGYVVFSRSGDAGSGTEVRGLHRVALNGSHIPLELATPGDLETVGDGLGWGLAYLEGQRGTIVVTTDRTVLLQRIAGPCNGSEDCPSGYCDEGICCNRECDDDEWCRAPETPGVCTPR